MNIAFYRSRDNNIFRNSIFTERLSTHLGQYHNVKMVIDYDKEYCLREMADAEVIILFSHGSHWGVFHSYEDNSGEEKAKYKWLIKTNENVDFLKDKKVLAFTCFSGMRNVKGLGEVAVSDHGCKVYFGFEAKINRTLPQEFLDSLPVVDQRAHNFISTVYSNVFEYTITQAIIRNLTFKQFAQLTKISLKKEIVKRISLEYGRTVHFNLHSKGAIPVNETADSIIIHGFEDEKFCS